MPTKLTKIDRAALRLINAEAAEALKAVAEKFGITLTTKGGRYSNAETGEIRFEIAVHKETEDGIVLDRKAIDFQRHAHLFGFEASDLHREFQDRGETYRIVGLAPKSPKFPVLAEQVRSGKTFKFPEQIVLFQLGKHRLMSPAPSVGA